MRYKLRGFISAAIMVGALLLVSCTATPFPPATSPAAPAAKPTTVPALAKPYGSLAVGTDMRSSTLDPQLSSSVVFFMTSVAVLDSLLYYDSNGRLTPGIAERWEISPDGKTHTFYIRKGVKFHNGDDLTGADVKFSIERSMAPESVQSDAPTWRSLVASVELKDVYTVALHLKQPQFDPLRGYEGDMSAVVPKKYIEEKGVDYWRKNFVGSGPWKVVRFVPGDRLELEAVENHWREVPKFKNLTVLNVLEEGTKVALLKTGELDVAQITPDSASGLKSAGLRVVSWSGGTQYFGFPFYDVIRPESYAFGDVRVRKAMQLGIDSKEIADKILGGYGEPFALYGASPTVYFWDPNQIRLDPYDPDGAKKLLTEAGYANGFDTRVYDVGGGSLLSTINLAVSGYWRKIGVKAEVIPVAYAAFTPKFVPKQLPEIWNSVYINVASAPPRAFERMTSYHSTKSTAKINTDPRLNELIDKVPTISDPNEKKKLALEAAVLAKNGYTALCIVAPHIVLAFSPKVNDLAHFNDSYITGLMFETITHSK